MSGERRAHRDRGRLGIPHLADENDVGVVTEDGSKTGEESHTGLLVDLALGHQRELVLDRVLERDDLSVAPGDRSEHGVERRRLSGSSGSRNEDEAVGALGGAREDLALFG
jgi:hypothetical protein